MLGHRALAPAVGPFLGLKMPRLITPQEWIKDTQNVAQVHKMEGAEQECGPEDALVVQVQKAEAEAPMMKTSASCPPTEEEGASGDPIQLPGQPPHGSEVVSLGGFTFVISDNSYMLLRGGANSKASIGV